jgi:hypothetical protein
MGSLRSLACGVAHAISLIAIVNSDLSIILPQQPAASAAPLRLDLHE